MPDTNIKSPLWSSSTKLIVGLTVVVLIGLLIGRFNNIIGPLILAIMLSYVLHPLVSKLNERTKMSWSMGVNLIYLVFVILIVYLFTATGVALVQQLQNLVRLVQGFVTDLPEIASNLSAQGYVLNIAPLGWRIDLSQIISQFNIDLLSLSEQILSALQPVLGQAGGLIGTLATSALTTLGWGAFILVISYFILLDAGEVPDVLKNIDLPGYVGDLRRLGRELGRIWNAFLRGQLVLFVMIVITSFILMTILGVRNAMGLALLAGIAKFIPYIGPLVAGITTALVAFFQPFNYLGFEPLTYALIVVAAAVILDQIFDNLVTPRIFGQTLGVHPAAVLIAAIIAASLIGLVGLLLAAPVLASLQMFGRYTLRKMVDLDPWPDPENTEVDLDIPLEKPIRSLVEKGRKILRKGNKNDKSKS